MIDCIMNRRSVRRYQDKDVPQELIMQLLEAARQAPSAKNTQPWKFIVIRDEAMRRAVIAADNNQQWMLDAPVLIAFVADPKVIAGVDYGCVDETTDCMDLKRAMRDTGAAIENALLAAESLGLATCWTAWFTQAAMKPVLNIPDDKYVVGIVAVGYGAEAPAARPRIPLEELVMYDGWKQVEVNK